MITIEDLPTSLEIIPDIEDFSLSCGGFSEYYNIKILEDNGGGDRESRWSILKLHMLRHRLFALMHTLDVEDKDSLRGCANYLESLEFQLQDAWGFPRTADRHTYWFKVPHCKCPYMDNTDAGRGMGLGRVINGNCPVHGS